MKPISRVAILLAAPLTLALPMLAGPASAAEPQVALTGDISPAVGVSHRVGDLPADRQLAVAVPLKLRDTAGLDRFLADVAELGLPAATEALTSLRQRVLSARARLRGASRIDLAVEEILERFHMRRYLKVKRTVRQEHTFKQARRGRP